MADYKRMVSYMYQYEKGLKRKNVGYARVELRSGQIKITLHMQLLGQLDSIFPTYLIQRDEIGMELIYLGDSILKSQLLDSKLIADEGNIMGSEHNFSEIGGILLFLNEDIFYATEWDDKPIIAKEVMEAMRPKSQKPNDKKEMSDLGAEEKVKDNAEEKLLGEEKSFKEEVIISEADDQKNEIEVTDNSIISGNPIEDEYLLPKYKLPGGYKFIEAFKNNPVRQSDQPLKMDMVQENEDTKQSVKQEDVIQETARKEDAVAETIGKAQEDKEEAENSENPSAARIFEHYPRIYPFEDNEITTCVKIEPKDIGYLPMDTWGLSNNSFLLHGFYCYHHLIFAKIKDRFGCRYIIGIPGIYNSREQFMARMFGFETFKSIRKRELRQGDFGYWYFVISL